MTTTRTWPYGARRGFHVDEVRAIKGGIAIVGIDSGGEGHVIYCAPQDCIGVAAGNRGWITFTEGGPTGGWWKFEKAQLL